MTSRLTVRDVMTSEPITVTTDTGFKEMVDLMIHHDIGAVPVVDADGKLEGIVTETDLLAKPAFGDERPKTRTKVRALLSGEQRWLRKALGLTAAEVMSKPVLSCEPTSPVALAARRLVDNRIGRLPVVDQARLVGIVSRRDLLRPFDRPDEAITADVQTVLDDPVAFEYGDDVTFSIDDGRVALTGSVEFPHDVTFLHDRVASIAGVVHVENDVTARRPEPAPPPPLIYGG